MRKLLIVLEIVVLIFFLYWHFKLGVVRYFDADEFAHLHWGYSLSAGERPYTDFFYLFPPFFLYLLSFLFKIFGRSVEVLINARILMFFIFAATTGVLFLIAKKMKNTTVALLAAVIFAFLPVPFDKMIEVRPDMAATGLAMLGMYLFIKAYEGNGEDKGKKKKYFFLSGLSYAVSLGFVPKTVFFLVPVGIVFLTSHLSYPSAPLGTGLSRLRRDGNNNTLYFFLGMATVGLILLVMLLSYGNLPFAFYSMTRMAESITATLGHKFYMLPNIFFYPNDAYYGEGGWSRPLIVNLVIYVSAAVWAIHRLVTFNLGGYEGNKGDKGKRNLGEFLVAGSFWANLVAFTYFYPLKHAQYLIPVAPFIAFYFADLLVSMNNGLTKFMRPLKIGQSLGGTLTVVFLGILTVAGFGMNQRKEQWINKDTLDKTAYFLATIPKDEPVFDLTGETIFFRGGYYFCCLPYGQYEEALYFKLPEIENDMKKRGAKYVHIGATGRLDAIPTLHRKYVTENFMPVAGNGALLKKK